VCVCKYLVLILLYKRFHLAVYLSGLSSCFVSCGKRKHIPGYAALVKVMVVVMSSESIVQVIQDYIIHGSSSPCLFFYRFLPPLSSQNYTHTISYRHS
jgi:hypothetical protein